MLMCLGICYSYFERALSFSLLNGLSSGTVPNQSALIFCIFTLTISPAFMCSSSAISEGILIISDPPIFFVFCIISFI